jgi:hypothetical protein
MNDALPEVVSEQEWQKAFDEPGVGNWPHSG